MIGLDHRNKDWRVVYNSNVGPFEAKRNRKAHVWARSLSVKVVVTVVPPSLPRKAIASAFPSQRPVTTSRHYRVTRPAFLHHDTRSLPTARNGRDEKRMVQRTHGPVTGPELLHASRTCAAQGAVQIPGDTRLANVSFGFIINKKINRREVKSPQHYYY